MGVLSPSGLETCEIGTSGWNDIYSANFEKINEEVGKMFDANKNAGDGTVSDPAATTAETLTDSTGGTPGNTISAISGSGADAAINDALASLIDEINKLRADNVALRTTIISLLAETRTTTGCGVLGG